MKMSAIFTRPITAAAFTALKSRKFEEPSKILAPRLNFLGEFRCRKSVSWDIRRRNKKNLKRVRASTSDGVPAFEKEALVEESLSFGEGRLEATLNYMSKWLAGAVLTAMLVWRHDAEASWAVIGSVINFALSVTLKRILNQERPSTLRSDPGMPSSHAQSFTFTTTFLILSIVERYGINALTIPLCGAFIVLGSYFTWLRVSQNLHTVSQVIVGAVFGMMFSILWFWSWNTYVLKLFMSKLWVRIVVILGGAAYILAFIRHSYHALAYDGKNDDYW